MSAVDNRSWCVCHKCEKTLTMADVTKTEFTRRARYWLWSIGKERATCPQCNGKDVNLDGDQAMV